MDGVSAILGPLIGGGASELVRIRNAMFPTYPNLQVASFALHIQQKRGTC